MSMQSGSIGDSTMGLGTDSMMSGATSSAAGPPGMNQPPGRSTHARAVDIAKRDKLARDADGSAEAMMKHRETQLAYPGTAAAERKERGQKLGANLRLAPSDGRDLVASVRATGGSDDPYSAKARSGYAVDFSQHHPANYVGHYHAFKIKSKYPVPGAAVLDDYRRRRGAANAQATDARLRIEAERRREAAAVEMVVHKGKQEVRLKTKMEEVLDQLEGTVQEREKLHEDTRIEARKHPADETQLHAFQLIKDKKLALLGDMFQSGNINVNAVEPSMLNSGLMVATSQGVLTAVRLYLQYGGDPNRANLAGEYPLHMAWNAWMRVPHTSPRRKFVLLKCLDIVRLLLSYSAQPDVVTHDGLTALHLAARFGHDNVAVMLLKAGANPHRQAEDGRSPLDLAKEREAKGLEGGTACRRVLTQWEAIEGERKLREFRQSWQVSMQRSSRRYREMAQHGKSVRNAADAPKPSDAGTTDIPGGAEMAAREEERRMLFGRGVEATRLLEGMELEERVRERNIVPVVRTAEVKLRETGGPGWMPLPSTDDDTVPLGPGATMRTDGARQGKAITNGDTREEEEANARALGLPTLAQSRLDAEGAGQLADLVDPYEGTEEKRAANMGTQKAAPGGGQLTRFGFADEDDAAGGGGGGGGDDGAGSVDGQAEEGGMGSRDPLQREVGNHLGHKRVLYRQWKRRQEELLPVAEAKIRSEIYDAVAGKDTGGGAAGRGGMGDGKGGLSAAEEAAAAFDAPPAGMEDDDIPLHLRPVNANESAADRARRLEELDRHRKAREKAKQAKVKVSSAEQGVIAVRNMKKRRKQAALHALGDAQGASSMNVNLRFTTGEQYVRRPALHSSLMRGARYRVDGRRKVGADTRLSGPYSGHLSEQDKRLDEETQLRAGSQLWGGSGIVGKGKTSFEEKASRAQETMAARGVDVGGQTGVVADDASVSVVPSENVESAALRQALSSDAVGESTARVGLSQQDADMKSRRLEGPMPRRLLPASGTAAEQQVALERDAARRSKELVQSDTASKRREAVMMSMRRQSVQGLSTAAAQSFLGLKSRAQVDAVSKSHIQLPREGALGIRLGRFGGPGAEAARQAAAVVSAEADGIEVTADEGRDPMAGSRRRRGGGGGRPTSTAQAARKAAKGEIHLVARPSSQTSLPGRGARGHSVHSRDRPGVPGHAGARLGSDRRRALPQPRDEEKVEYGPLHGPGALAVGRAEGLLDMSQFERLAPVFGRGVQGRAAKASEVFGDADDDALHAARGKGKRTAVDRAKEAAAAAKALGKNAGLKMALAALGQSRKAKKADASVSDDPYAFASRKKAVVGKYSRFAAMEETWSKATFDPRLPVEAFD